MTLLSPLALLFGLIAAVPLILHLHKNRKRTVMLFSTNRFFTESVVRTQRRLKLRRWLLLLLRMAACVLLALALSQPILAWSGLTSAKGTRDLLIILDDSLSTTASTSSPAMTVFGLGRDQALAAIDHLVTGDRAAIITTTGQLICDGDSPSSDLLSIRGELANLQPTQSAGDLPAALRTAAAFFNDYENGRARAALILTDGQSTDWRSGQWPALPLGCTTQIVILGQPATDNVTADHLSLATPGSSAVIGQPNAVTVRIINHASARRRAQLHLLVNNQLEADQPIELPGQSAILRTFPLTFTKPGEHRIQLNLLALHDAVPADDSIFAVANVQSQLPILLVHGPETSNQRSGAFYLTAALQAVTSGSEADVKVQSIPANQLTADKLSAYRVVFLCDAERLTPDATAAVRNFVAQGGGLAIFPGSRIDADWYNTELADLLPASIGPPLAITDHPLPIVQADTTHPLLSRFSDDLRAAISGITVTQARDLQTHNSFRGRGWPIAQLDGDHPFILQRTYTPRQSESSTSGPPAFGSGGNVVLLACSPEPQSTNLPLRRLFIPFIHRLAAYLASSNASSTPLAYTVGSTIVLPPNAVSFDVDHPPAAVSSDNLLVPTHVIPLAASPQLALTLPSTGFYALGPLTLAANTPRSESNPAVISNLNPLTAPDWHLMGETHFSGPGPEASATPDFSALLSASRSGRGYWHTLLYVVLIVILIEPLIANYTTRPARQARKLPILGQRDSIAPDSSPEAV